MPLANPQTFAPQPGPAAAGPLLIDDAQTCEFLLHRDAYTSATLFEREMQAFFRSSWVYLAHESQIPQANDFLTERIGVTPVIVLRDEDGQLRALINRCAHRGALVCRARSGHAKGFTCMFHAWTYTNTGRLTGVPDRAGYPPSFDLAERSLRAVAKLESYRGLIFASLNPDAPSLESHLGKARRYLDFILDKYPAGLQFASGATHYSVGANWKLQMENSLDFYHVPFVHKSFFDVLRRNGIETGKSTAHEMRSDFAFYLGNGHGTVVLDEHGERFQHLMLFPNLVILENPAPQFRVIRPIAVDRTEVTGYAYFATASDPAQRAAKLRRYEKFYGPMGLGTPDDAEAFHACQAGLRAEGCAPWVDLSRGLGRANLDVSDPLGPYEDSGNITDDTVYRGLYRHWNQKIVHDFRSG